MLFKVYTQSPPKVKIADVSTQHISAIYERLKAKGSAAEAWKHEIDSNGSIVAKSADVDYKLEIYRELESAVKAIVDFVDSVMRSENQPVARADLNDAIQAAGLKVVGLQLSDVISDIIAFSDGDPNSSTTWADFKAMFTSGS